MERTSLTQSSDFQKRSARSGVPSSPRPGSPLTSPGRPGTPSNLDLRTLLRASGEPVSPTARLRERITQFIPLLEAIDLNRLDSIFDKIFSNPKFYEKQHNQITSERLEKAKQEIKDEINNQSTENSSVQLQLRRTSESALPKAQKRLLLEGVCATIDKLVEAKKVADLEILKLVYHWDEGIGSNSALGKLFTNETARINNPFFVALFKCFEFYNNIFGNIKKALKMCQSYEQQTLLLAEKRTDFKKQRDHKILENEIDALTQTLENQQEEILLKIQIPCENFALGIQVIRETIDQEIQKVVNRTHLFSLSDPENIRPDLEMVQILSVNEEKIKRIGELVKKLIDPNLSAASMSARRRDN